jgi:hypothetical protein
MEMKNGKAKEKATRHPCSGERADAENAASTMSNRNTNTADTTTLEAQMWGASAMRPPRQSGAAGARRRLGTARENQEAAMLLKFRCVSLPSLQRAQMMRARKHA